MSVARLNKKLNLTTVGQKSIQFVLFQVIFVVIFVFLAIKNLHVVIKELNMFLMIAGKNLTKNVLKHQRSKEI